MPPICLCMIVRNEAAVILRCLSSVRPFISHWAIVDTGSTDQTRALIRRALDKLPGKLVTRHWTNDFSIHRNQANTLAIKVMGTDQGFLFFIDADETLVLTDRTQFLRLLARRTTISWWAVHGDWCFRKLGIVRADVAGEWKGARHEQLQLRSSSKLTNQVQPWAHLLMVTTAIDGKMSTTRSRTWPRYCRTTLAKCQSIFVPAFSWGERTKLSGTFIEQPSAISWP